MSKKNKKKHDNTIILFVSDPKNWLNLIFCLFFVAKIKLCQDREWSCDLHVLGRTVKCLTVGRERTLAVPDSGMAADSNTSSTLAEKQRHIS